MLGSLKENCLTSYQTQGVSESSSLEPLNPRILGPLFSQPILHDRLRRRSGREKNHK